MRTKDTDVPVILRLHEFSNWAVIVALGALVIFFAVSADGFLTTTNFYNLIQNNVVMLAIVAIAMTLVVTSGGIDLSVGVSVDMASMTFIMLLAVGTSVFLAVPAGIAAALCVGVLNALIITQLKISPFLATLGILFIGQSVQKIASDGGKPIYLATGEYPAIFDTIVRTQILGVPTPMVVLALVAIGIYLLIHRSVFGRYVRALGAQPGVAWYSGVRVNKTNALVYIIAAGLCGITGILLSSTVRSYVPLSGDGYLLDAIGATFIGTTISSERRPSVIGTLIGVLLLAITRNGLLLLGWNFYWQQVGIGVLVFAVLALSFGLKGRAD